MKISAILPAICASMLIAGATHCAAEPVWATGNSLLEVIGYDIQAHDTNQKLTDYQTNAVCLLLGYFNGFAEASALSSHYNTGALPFSLPDNITNNEIERIVYDFLKTNPDKLKLKGVALVVAALAKEYPNPAFTPPSGEKSFLGTGGE